MFFENPVRQAVQAAGGPTKTSNALGVSNAAVHAWIRNRIVPDLDKAKKLAELANVPVERIRPC